MADTKLSALATGTVPQYLYGIQGGASKKYNSSGMFNVKDYGALGTGAGDDTTFIQAALDAAYAYGTTAGGGEARLGTIVYFPPGAYPITSRLHDENAGAGACVNLVGAGRNCTRLYGSFAGYIIDKSMNSEVTHSGSGIASIESIRDMQIVNNNNAQYSGAVRLNFSVGGSIERCRLTGFTGLDASCNVFGLSILNTNFSGLGENIANSVGACLQQGTITGGKFGSFKDAIRIGGGDTGDAGTGSYNESGASGVSITQVSIEVCDTAIRVGVDLEGNTAQAQGCAIQGVQTEGCNYSLVVGSAAGLVVSGCAFTGTVWTDAAPLKCGILISSLQGGAFVGNTVAQAASVAKIDLNNTSGSDIVFVATHTGTASGGGVAWRLPPAFVGPSRFRYIGCDNPTAAMAVADLPASPIEGMEFDVTDGTIGSGGAWGGTVTGGGSTHCKVRYNGSNWTAVGK